MGGEAPVVALMVGGDVDVAEGAKANISCQPRSAMSAQSRGPSRLASGVRPKAELSGRLFGNGQRPVHVFDLP